jgi:hypothetical protein
MTKAEKERFALLARIGCILCKQHGIQTTDTPTEIHHIRRYGGKRSLSPTIGLCAYHHRLGDTAVHSLGNKAFEKYWGFTLNELLEKNEEALNDLLQKKS